MKFFRWIAGLILLFWIIALIFQLGGTLINLLLLVAGILFICDIVTSKRKASR